MIKIKFPHKPGHIGGPSSFQLRFEVELKKNNFKILDPSSKVKPDFIFIIGGTKRILWLLTNKLNKVKIIHRLDGLDSNFKFNIKYLKFNLLKLLRNLNVILIANLFSDRIIFQSKYLQNYWQKYLLKNKLNNTVIYNGVNINDFNPDSKEIQNKNGIICIEGSINSSYAIEILNSLTNFKITLVGNIENAFKNKITNKNIDYKGVLKREDIPSILNKHKIYLCLEPNPPCPNSVIEAMSCGLPIIGFNSGSLNELVNDCGILTPIELVGTEPSKKSLKKLSNSINLVYDNYEKYESKARLNVINNFDIKNITRSYINFFCND
jgi:glycosyltransferase involved in cell wall biosynthesis